MPRLNHKNLGSVQKTAYLTATIVSVDSEFDTACFTGTGNCPAGSDIPIFYHCQYEEGEEPAQRSNGALEGASGAFSEDDEVIVQCEVVDSTTYKPLYVMGFVDKPKQCCFKEKWHQSLTEYHDWVETYMWFEDLPVVPFEIITVPEDYKSSYLKMRHTGSQTGLTHSSTSKMKLEWVTTDVPETDMCNRLRLKFNFSGTYPINQYFWPTITSLTISGPTGSPATIIFGANSQFFIENPELVDNLLDDMGGAEQEIDLKDYGATFEGPPRYISLDSKCRAGEFPPIYRATQSLDLYYLEFF